MNFFGCCFKSCYIYIYNYAVMTNCVACQYVPVSELECMIVIVDTVIEDFVFLCVLGIFSDKCM